MDELDQLWKGLQQATPENPSPLAIPDLERRSASERILRRYDRKLAGYWYFNQLLTGVALGMAIVNYRNGVLFVLLLILAVALGIFAYNVYGTRKRLRALSLDFSSDLPSAVEQLIGVIRTQITAETRISRVLVPFSVVLGTMLVLSFRGVPLENLWLDRGLFYAVAGATVGVVVLTFALPSSVLYRNQERQIAELERIVKD